MVSLEEGVIALNGKTHKIKSFEVWFLTPFGLVTTLPEAITVCSDANISTTTNIRAVPVAVSNDETPLIYEVIA